MQDVYPGDHPSLLDLAGLAGTKALIAGPWTIAQSAQWIRRPCLRIVLEYKG